MVKRRKSGNKSPDSIARDIRAELRSFLRICRDLYSPICRFKPYADPAGHTRYFVLFDVYEPKEIRGIQIKTNVLGLPDETIHDRVLEFAKTVWHLKDRLTQLADAIRQSIDLDAIAKQSTNLLVSADLANMKKHGRCENRSTLNPQLGPVKFDVSKSGPLELFYDGAMKCKELVVTHPVPIPFAVDVLVHDGASALGDARDIIKLAFLDWLPIIQQLGVLSANEPEAAALHSILLAPDR